ncbi:MAG: DUF4827 family protein [Muribaculaceae bacterium]|nr:DUF4827 family protein [Muribaculaceae bacterium]
MNITKTIIAAGAVALAFCSCSKHESYAALLTEEEKAVNHFLADKRVELSLPENLEFETAGGNANEAPYYRMDSDGTVYMQVLKTGDRENNKAADNDLIFFRYTRYDLKEIMNSGSTSGAGNATEMTDPKSFRFNNYTLSSSAQYGSGIQVPLQYLGVDCEVNIVVKSQYGFTGEIAYVTPYLFSIRYYRSKL